MLSAHLNRVDRDDQAPPLGQYPLRPAYPLAAPVDRVDAGEGLETLAGDYGLVFSQIEDAVFCERAGRAGSTYRLGTWVESRLAKSRDPGNGTPGFSWRRSCRIEADPKPGACRVGDPLQCARGRMDAAALKAGHDRLCRPHAFG